MKNERDNKIRILFLRSTFVLLQRNKERKKAKAGDGKTFPCCHHRTLEVINYATLRVFRIRVSPLLWLQYRIFLVFHPVCIQRVAIILYVNSRKCRTLKYEFIRIKFLRSLRFIYPRKSEYKCSDL